MKLMIDISEELYAKVPTLINKGNIWIGDVLDAVKNGTPLPKGDMRLINANELLNNLSNTAVYDDDYYYSIVYHVINNAPTIIEADGGEEDEKTE